MNRSLSCILILLLLGSRFLSEGFQQTGQETWTDLALSLRRESEPYSVYCEGGWNGTGSYTSSRELEVECGGRVINLCSFLLGERRVLRLSWNRNMFMVGVSNTTISVGSPCSASRKMGGRKGHDSSIFLSLSCCSRRKNLFGQRRKENRRRVYSWGG